jgi:hypothetical protein
MNVESADVRITKRITNEIRVSIETTSAAINQGEEHAIVNAC